MNDTIKDNVYYKGMLSNNQHERLAKSLSQYKGPVMLCGYRGKFSYLYDRRLANAGFHCYKIMDTHAHSVQTDPEEPRPKRTEYVWTNYIFPGLKEVDIKE